MTNTLSRQSPQVKPSPMVDIARSLNNDWVTLYARETYRKPGTFRLCYPAEGIKFLYIEEFKIDAELRGKGVGTRVLKELCEWADYYRMPLCLVCSPDNEEGLSTYQRTANFVRLLSWYLKFGFIQGDGAFMLRWPAKQSRKG